MTVQTTSIYTCDRDGTVSAPVTGGMPEGWSSIQVSTVPTYVAPAEGQPAMPLMPRMMSMIVCPACTAVVADATRKVAPAKK
jgi:hypothetical protein